MDVKLLAPFVEAIANVMPKLGFQSVSRSGLRIAQNTVKCDGVIASISLIGMLKGNIYYNIDTESAKKIASQMMMGMPVNELDEMAQSAICELSNMLAANAAITLETQGVQIDISPPTLITGCSDVSTNTNAKGIVVEMKIDDATIEVNMLISS